MEAKKRTIVSVRQENEEPLTNAAKAVRTSPTAIVNEILVLFLAEYVKRKAVSNAIITGSIPVPEGVQA